MIDHTFFCSKQRPQRNQPERHVSFLKYLNLCPTFFLFFVFCCGQPLKLCEDFLRQLERLASYDYEKIRKVGGVSGHHQPRKSRRYFFVNKYICHVILSYNSKNKSHSI